jgi:CheY-like chemotaxis protein
MSKYSIMQSDTRHSVLIAEDNVVNQKVISLLMDLLGVSADIVGNGQQAIEAAERDSYALILMDIMMPVVDGFDAAFRIRLSEFGHAKHIPIIACTALDKDKICEQCVRCGIDDYIAKPYSKEVLQEKIEAWSQIKMYSHVTATELERKMKALPMQVDEWSDEPPIDDHTWKMLYGLEQLDDVLSLFLNITQTLLAQLDSAIHRKDIEIVKQMVNEIKGSSYAVTARQMASICRELEQAGEAENWSEAEKLYTALGLAFARVREFITVKRAA